MQLARDARGVHGMKAWSDDSPCGTLDVLQSVRQVASSRMCFICCQFGADNPCGCKIIGPTLGFFLLIILAIFCWPIGAIVWCCSRETGVSIMRTPMNAWTAVSDAIPI